MKAEKLITKLLPSYEQRKKIEQVRAKVHSILSKNGEKKEFDKFVSMIEKAIRNLPEYKEWAKACAETVDYCELCELPFEEAGLRKEVHHTPLTLYEIVNYEIEEMLKSNQYVTSTEIIDRVIEKHLDGEVTFSVLCPCCHKRCHFEKKEYGDEVSLYKKHESEEKQKLESEE